MTLQGQARQLLAQLELVSHVPAANLDPDRVHGGEDHPGGKRPRGGIDHRDPADEDGERTPVHLKSHEHFWAQFWRCETDAQLERLIGELEAALEAWQRTPRPVKDSPAWQELVAKDTRKAREIAADWNIPKETVWMLKRRYGTNRNRAA